MIPTYQREQVLVDTLDYLLAQTMRAAEILVVDQTPQHEPEVEARLQQLQDSGDIRWLRLSKPSITHAMNHGLQQASNDWVLYLDDDIVPAPDLIAAHASHLDDDEVSAIVGQVLQPGQSPCSTLPADRGAGIWRDLNFPFNTDRPAEIENSMAGNLCVRRERALRVGGFDENFKGVAYRFETEFARRLLRGGGKIRYVPRARIDHLQAQRGGTRAYGNPLCSPSPDHSVGEYYFALREAQGLERWSYIAWRMFRSVRTKFHLSKPWWIPVKLTGEIRGLIWALTLDKNKPKYLNTIAN